MSTLVPGTLVPPPRIMKSFKLNSKKLRSSLLHTWLILVRLWVRILTKIVDGYGVKPMQFRLYTHPLWLTLKCLAICVLATELYQIKIQIQKAYQKAWEPLNKVNKKASNQLRKCWTWRVQISIYTKLGRISNLTQNNLEFDMNHQIRNSRSNLTFKIEFKIWI